MINITYDDKKHQINKKKKGRVQVLQHKNECFVALESGWDFS